MPQVYTARVVTTRTGEYLGRICTVWDAGGEGYIGSYFEQVRHMRPGVCANLGVNARYLAAREAHEGSAPELRSFWE